MEKAFNIRINETAHGFSIHHSIRVKNRKSLDQTSKEIMCTHNFDDKASLKTLSELIQEDPLDTELRELWLQRIHLHIFESAVSHTFRQDGESLFTGNSEVFSFNKDDLQIKEARWSDGNEYRNIGPSGSREIWSVPENLIEEVLKITGAESLAALLQKIEGPDYFEVYRAVKEVAAENNSYSQTRN
jgi:hypothetical protein